MAEREVAEEGLGETKRSVFSDVSKTEESFICSTTRATQPLNGLDERSICHPQATRTTIVAKSACLARQNRPPPIQEVKKNQEKLGMATLLVAPLAPAMIP